MCGIIGYIGCREAHKVLLSGLSRLEYRGYDSAGIAVLDEEGLHIRRAVGQLNNLVSEVEAVTPTGHLGIGHTRWATHGRSTIENAHPHLSSDGRVAVIHNGIIENYRKLKSDRLKGVKMRGDTDTEIAANIIAAELRTDNDVHKALRRSMKRFEGAYALGVISPEEPDVLHVARVGSPLIIGVGDGEMFVASDVPAILEYTNKIIYLDEGESARLTADRYEVYGADGKIRRTRAKKVDLSLEQAEKGGFPHFMLKEIYEQPEAIASTLQGRIQGQRIDLDEIGISKTKLKRFKRVQLLACGTSYYSAVVAKYALQEHAQIAVDVDIASEFRYANPMIDRSTLVICISQSGETTDTKVAAELAKGKGATILAVCNVMGSSIPRMADATLYTRAGIEIGVASTKAYTTQLAALLMFAVYLGRVRDTMSAAAEKRVIKELQQLPELLKKILDGKLVGVKRAADRFRDVYNFMFIGRRYNYATAFEGALKLKEISYIHAEGYGAGEMKHGPLALVEGTFPTVVICPDSPYYDKTISNIREIKARDGIIVAVASEGDKEIKALADYLIYVPRTSEMLSPILTVVPLQLLAYHTAVNRGCDPDKPRNLAKAVTVE